VVVFMVKVVSFVNYKGGVGKTTLAVEISAALAYHYDKRTLLIDADPQTNATFYLMDEHTWERYARSGRTMKELFDAALNNQHIDIRNIIVSSGLEIHQRTQNLHVIPSHLDLHSIDLDIASRIGKEALKARTILKEGIDPIKDDYDYIIIDCPPNMYFITQNAIVASDSVVIVVLPEYLAIIGISLIHRIINMLNEDIRRQVEKFGGRFEGARVKGIIFNRVRHGPYGILVDQRRSMNDVRRQWPDITFENYVSETVRFPERTRMKIPISISGYAADSRYEAAIQRVAEEFLRRV